MSGLVPYPVNEASRLAALQFLKLMESDFQAEMDQTVELAADLLDCPIALISLVEEDYQWFSAKCGLDADQTSREDAFCAHAIMSPHPLVVPDTLLDPRFRENPLVTGNPGIRFYAGIPLSCDGVHYLGTLCVIDTKPRRIDQNQIAILKRLAVLVEGFFKAVETTAIAQAAKEEVSVSAQLFEQAGEIAGVGAWQVNVDTGQVHWSDQVFRTHDLEPGRQPTLEEALAYYPGHEREVVSACINHTLETGDPFHFDADFMTARGRQRRVRCIGSLKGGEKGERILLGVFMDITAQHEVHLELVRAAMQDPLTGLLNRTAFLERMQAAIATGPGTGSLLLLDLDDFKSINDTLGHEAGDHVLLEVAGRMQNVVELAGHCARLGGDEFAVYVPCDPEPVAEAIIQKIKQPISYGVHTIHTGATIGSVSLEQSNGSMPELYKFADITLYKAKQTSKARHLKYHPSYLGEVLKRRRSLDFVREALSADRVVPVYMPIWDVSQSTVTAAEALVRVEGLEGHLIEPCYYMEAFTDPDLGLALDLRMLERVSEDLCNARQTLEGFQISVNAGTAAMRSERYLRALLDFHERVAQRGVRLCLEVVENVLIDESNIGLSKTFAEISSAGIAIALDDFGTGYASLSHLQAYPIDIVKIDRHFVKGLGKEADKTAIVRAMVDLGITLDKQVIAEGAETGESVDLLRQLRCHKVQGYWIGKPAAWQDFQCLLTPTELTSPKSFDLDGTYSR